MICLAIDPGPAESAWAVVASDDKVIAHGKWANDRLLNDLCSALGGLSGYAGVIAIEMIASYGMPVGAEVFETCVWIGRFRQALEMAGRRPHRIHLVKRADVKLHLCKSPKANDATIRQAIIDRYGPGKEKAIGVKKARGPLYGVKADAWAALAVALYQLDHEDAIDRAPIPGEDLFQ